jgi:hypothetical protein
MGITAILRFTILTISGAASVLGILVATGVLVPARIPENLRVIMGIVISLYGTYRFVIAYFQYRERP